MAERMILYTSQSEGITLGVQGETWMECLLALSEEFGDGLMPLYEKTKDELTNLSAAVADAFEEEIEEIAEKQAQKVIDETEREQEDESLDVFTPSEDQDSDSEEVDDSQDDVDGTGSTGDSPVCSICGEETTKDYAELTEQMHGEVRCPACVT